MSLKGRGQGVDLGTSTLSLMRSIFFSFLGLEFPYESLNLLPFFVLLSPRPQRFGPPIAADGAAEDEYAIRCSIAAIIILLAAVLHHCVIAISDVLAPHLPLP
ncbi:ndufb9, NADH-ubiquinone oxidoreductase [Datura stramonium]|uniref:Ndufb9, NADH-ubiquinone oxidoreductase n=1 Tax=Datura stramonium TaxID=4076 RepID=A0ABS8RI88_DATST|nr:ndufb9, NADH-ubiquinone oxidoreductase [Datura stramonium]